MIWVVWIFIDLRDREGIMQLVINPETVSAEVMATAESIRSEYVVEVTGLVEAREQANRTCQLEQ